MQVEGMLTLFNTLKEARELAVLTGLTPTEITIRAGGECQFFTTALGVELTQYSGQDVRISDEGQGGE